MTEPTHPCDLAILDALRRGGRPLLARQVAGMIGLSAQAVGARMRRLVCEQRVFRKTRITGSLIELEYIIHPSPKALSQTERMGTAPTAAPDPPARSRSIAKRRRVA